MQGRGSKKEIHHEAISHGDAKSSHAMRNLHMLCEIQKGRSCKAHLEHFLESIIYIYIISKLRKSGVQFIKWCANQSWNEEVMAIWRQLRQVEKEFRITFPWCETFHTKFPWCENFHTEFFLCEKFHITLSLMWKFLHHLFVMRKCNI